MTDERLAERLAAMRARCERWQRDPLANFTDYASNARADLPALLAVAEAAAEWRAAEHGDDVIRRTDHSGYRLIKAKQGLLGALDALAGEEGA